MATYMGNFDYLRDKLDIDPIKEQARFEECLEAMEKYDTPWWYEHRHDDMALAIKQIDEPVLLIRWKVFKAAVEKILERTLLEGELTSSNTELLAEVKAKYLQISNK